MGGIELNATDDELVFEERPVEKQKVAADKPLASDQRPAASQAAAAKNKAISVEAESMARRESSFLEEASGVGTPEPPLVTLNLKSAMMISEPEQTTSELVLEVEPKTRAKPEVEIEAAPITVVSESDSVLSAPVSDIPTKLNFVDKSDEIVRLASSVARLEQLKKENIERNSQASARVVEAASSAAPIPPTSSAAPIPPASSAAPIPPASSAAPIPPASSVAPGPQTPSPSLAQPAAVSTAAQVSAQPSGVSSLLLNERRAVNQNAESSEKRQAIDLFETLLGSAVKGGASDVLLKQGQVPMFRWNGELYPSRNGPRLDSRFFENLAAAILSPVHCDRLNDIHDVDFSFQSHRGGRVRVNIFHQRGELGLVARLIPTEIPTFEKLEMGSSVRQLMDQKRGLILVTGATGSGKSTTLAAMLDYINSTRTSHVITIEDPIEFVHNDKRSMFNQRELGLDTRSYAAALKSALRQAPDVILVGELRDAETTEVALQAAETGHLVLSTLHTNDAADSILRILGITGLDKETIVRAQLADSLRGVVSQRLIKRKDRPGRVAAQEIMVNTATIREKLLKGGHPSVVRDFIVQGAHSGMQSFDQHLIQLVNSGTVDYEEALRNATNRDDFALRFNGVSDGREAS